MDINEFKQLSSEQKLEVLFAELQSINKRVESIPTRHKDKNYDLQQVAELLNVSYQSVYRWVVNLQEVVPVFTEKSRMLLSWQSIETLSQLHHKPIIY